jgi:hypothetical protein
MKRASVTITAVLGLLAVSGAMTAPPVRAAGTITFSDQDFNAGDWGLIEFAVGGGTTSVTRETSEGNPGAYRQITNTVPTPSSGGYATVFGIQLRADATYDPAVRGAIDSVDYSEDATLLSGFNQGQATGPALRQDGHFYLVRGLLTPVSECLGTWCPRGLANLHQQDFILVVGGSPADPAGFFDETSHPDFSDTGSEIKFGFYRANGVVYPDGGYTIVGGIDNWSITLYIPFEDTTPPTVTCSATPGKLWPANHKLVEVNADVRVRDSDSGPAGFTLVSVTSSEPDNGLGDGDTVNDRQGWNAGSADVAGLLRAERSGNGTGRVYALTYEGADTAGNTVTCVTTVIVPHDKGK